jgi:hypothetical protein
MNFEKKFLKFNHIRKDNERDPFYYAGIVLATKSEIELKNKNVTYDRLQIRNVSFNKLY